MWQSPRDLSIGRLHWRTRLSSSMLSRSGRLALWSEVLTPNGTGPIFITAICSANGFNWGCRPPLGFYYQDQTLQKTIATSYLSPKEQFEALPQ